MTELSRYWGGIVTGDSGPYSFDQFTDVWNDIFLVDNTTQAPLKGITNELAVTGAISPVAIDTGSAIVDGTYYTNSASVTIVIPTPGASTRIDRIVLEKDWTAQTIRLARVAGVEGGGAPALTQTDGSVWQVSLAQVSITTGGAITLTNERIFIYSPDSLDFSGSVDGQVLTSTGPTTDPAWEDIAPLFSDTDVIVENPNVFTTVLDQAIPAGTFGATQGIILRCVLSVDQSQGAARTLQVRFTYGATVMLTISGAIASDASRKGGLMYVFLRNDGATNSQVLAAWIHLAQNSAHYEAGGQGTAAEDSTTTLNLKVEVDYDVSSANLDFQLESIEILQPIG